MEKLQKMIRVRRVGNSNFFFCVHFFNTQSLFILFVCGKAVVGSAISSSHNVWVSGLSFNTKAADLKNLFGKYGKVIFRRPFCPLWLKSNSYLLPSGFKCQSPNKRAQPWLKVLWSGDHVFQCRGDTLHLSTGLLRAWWTRNICWMRKWCELQNVKAELVASQLQATHRQRTIQ